MTITEKQHTNENYYISMEIETRYGMTYYEVSVCPLLNAWEGGSPIKSIVYSMDERKKALATFNRYKREYI